MFTALIAALALQATPVCVNNGHNRHRSQTEVQKFKRTHPCPAGTDQGSIRHCAGYEVDHICPLACWNPHIRACGPDKAENMQWLTSAQNHKKGASCVQCPKK